MYHDHDEDDNQSQMSSRSSRSEIRSSDYTNRNGVHRHGNGDDPAAARTVSTAAAATIPNSSRAKEVDDLLSKELYQLSFADRNAINEEIHGVRCLAPNETPEFLHQSLSNLQRELDAMPYKPAYDKAQAYARDPSTAKTSFVNTTEFRLKFLRCELFDAATAAVRLTKYLDLIAEMYGLFALQRKIQLTDFSKHELQILRAGYFQMLPFRDRSGRRVMCIVGNMGIQYDPSVRVRAVLFCFALRVWATSVCDMSIAIVMI
jgi:hypothetical protein